MRSIAKQFAIVFFVGFIALMLALAYSSMTSGDLLSEQPFLAALRSFGLGWMAAGMALWIVLRREEGGKPEINLPLWLTVGSGCVLLSLAVLFPFMPDAVYLMWAGLGLTMAALVIGTLAMIFAPAYPKPITSRWPEGGETQTNPHVPAIDLHLPNDQPVEPDDLTKITGIGPKAQEVLNQAGIVTFIEVANRSPDALKDVLEAAHLKAPIDPASWPQQADLAARGDWDGLTALQKKLRASRSVH